jgi:hypothetical protein
MIPSHTIKQAEFYQDVEFAIIKACGNGSSLMDIVAVLEYMKTITLTQILEEKKRE